MLDNVGLRYPHRASGAKAPRTLRPLPLLRFAASATGGAHLCSIQYYLRFWLGICRTSLAVSALRIMRYCPKTRGRSCAPFYSTHIYQQAKLPPAYRAKRHIRGQFLFIRLFSGGVLRCHSLIKSAPHPRWSRGHRSAAELPAFRHRWSGRQHTFLPLRQTGCHHPHTGCRSAPLP